MTTVLTFGTFDVLHVGHLRILERTAALGERLVVGVSADALNIAKKGRAPVFPQEQRMRLIAALRCVDEVFLEESLQAKREYLLRYQADVLAMGDDWRGKFDEFSDVCRVIDRAANVKVTSGSCVPRALSKEKYGASQEVPRRC